jgi:hypothetical protein
LQPPKHDSKGWQVESPWQAVASVQQFEEAQEAQSALPKGKPQTVV